MLFRLKFTSTDSAGHGGCRSTTAERLTTSAVASQIASRPTSFSSLTSKSSQVQSVSFVVTSTDVELIIVAFSNVVCIIVT